MEMTKLTIRIPTTVLARAKAYAQMNQTSVTRLVSLYLSQLPAEDNYLKDAPIVQRDLRPGRCRRYRRLSFWR